ncbi:hypothetical protein CEUSTIGMA_g13478.t1 [Chlamydomonas eustigma]|uniref:Uncharacterized protein n=1 Tax=Chlamydomonas eustigma TaxID=1157962 RepID=A0A250XSM4_9CHLO|nr:hypothetical protein CEUSTIGMA_g13478.t1 [Chlamydomonas eustigma]|eukprot:GAX86064.1 hypothetical protein CEUSTIGMA_g13478.t1 [Chlamydomonas eustigma]
MTTETIDVEQTCKDLAKTMGPDDRYAICEAGPEHLIFVQRADQDNFCAATLEGSDAILDFMAMIAASIGTETRTDDELQNLTINVPCKALMSLDKSYDGSTVEIKTVFCKLTVGLLAKLLKYGEACIRGRNIARKVSTHGTSQTIGRGPDAACTASYVADNDIIEL